MEKNKKYISSIIDYIDVDLNYMFNTTALSDTTYSYSVSAVISSDYDLNGVTAELWSKSYQLVAPKSLTKTSSSGFQIKENLKLDYNKYDSLATSFKEQYGIASDTKLTILINIRSNTTIKDYSKSVPATKTISLVMPLNKAVTDITVTGVEPVSTNVTETIKGGKHINYVLLVASVIAMLVSAPICFISFYKLFAIFLRKKACKFNHITKIQKYMINLYTVIRMNIKESFDIYFDLVEDPRSQAHITYKLSDI